MRHKTLEGAFAGEWQLRDNIVLVSLVPRFDILAPKGSLALSPDGLQYGELMITTADVARRCFVCRHITTGAA